MLTLLMEGRALTAKELAYGAGVVPATATSHLARLRDDGLVTWAAQGRHKYFRLASPAVAQLVESLMVIARPAAPRAASDEPIRVARFCYDHLAGRLGTRLAASLLDRGLLEAGDGAYAVAGAGERWFAGFGIDLGALRRSRRAFARPCLDWSERTDHLGGAVGAALADRMTELGWIARRKRSRVVTVTADGAEALRRELGVTLDGAGTPPSSEE
jgi:hypothetical protein